jgi:competence protein ComEA
MRLLEKIQKLKIVDGFLVLGFLLVILGIGMNFKDQFLTKEEVKVESKGVGSTAKNDIQVDSKVIIDISGEVTNPGVYKLKNGARVEEVLIMSGGLSAKADRDWVDKNLNRAEKLYDGEKIYIPKVGENLIISSTPLARGATVVRINSASIEELDKLDGVGPSIAQRIIDYRMENGGFKSVEEIKLVPGIGDKMFEKIKNEIQL